ncbi:MAG TPA: methylmalonyl-CoA epimerase [Gemmatimonadaceae bacterium]|nr:methylmalonyl-CoA epimerase [Gemmatimonadaceae bacterium]
MQPGSPKGTRIAHIGIAFSSLETQLPFYRDILGLEEAEVADSDGARIVAFRAGGPLVELLEAAGPETPIGKFIARRGAAIHHVCFSVDDIDEMLARCRSAGIALIDDVPRLGAEGKRIAFIHPSSTGGVLVELSEH